jgi:DNA topoisomerase VI subunit B
MQALVEQGQRWLRNTFSESAEVTPAGAGKVSISGAKRLHASVCAELDGLAVEASARLRRTTFQTSRLFDFCSEKELTAQTGHDPAEWPLVILKELMDNALDACEEANVSPKIEIAVGSGGIVLTDNGPGIPASTVEGILDYSVRVSSREAYVSPTRGAQGNALKTILAMPFVLGDDHGQMDISTRGQRHEIVFAVDRVRQQPTITHAVHAGNVKNGASITVHWPDSACSKLADAGAGFLQLADDYTWLNPHLTLILDWFGRCTAINATASNWRKWLPSEPTSPHWYGQEEFERLISAYVAHDQDRGADRSVRELVREFRGLTGTAKQKAVLDETALSHTRLSSLVNGGNLQHAVIANLLEAMQKHSKPVKPAALGIIGEAHVRARMQQLGCEMESFQYKRVAELDNEGLPTVIETAFAWRGEECTEPRRLITGVNWSPGITNPFRTLGSTYGDGLTAMLEKRFAGRDEPIVFLLHCAHPRVRYTDRGKSALVLK